MATKIKAQAQTETPATIASEVDPFEAAFAELAALDAAGEVAKPATLVEKSAVSAEEPTVSAEEPVASTKIVTKTVGELTPEEIAKARQVAAAKDAGETELEMPDAPAGTQTEIKTEPAKRPVSTSEPQISGEDVLRQLAGMIQQPQQTTQQPTSQEQPTFSPAELTKLQGFYKEWPEVGEAVNILARAQAKQIIDHVFSNLAATIGPKLAMIDELATVQQINELEHAVPDYGDIRDKVIKWVGEQPTYLKGAYQRVIDDGTADEVVDLINRYKKETGVQTNGTAAPILTTSKPVLKATEPSAQVKQAAAALAPVGSKRSGAVTTIGSQDYDGAFEEAAKLLT